MKTEQRSEKGQAIVMIALAIMGLFGLIALAMDGGQAFSDRRQAQNAADAAALAASQAYNNNQPYSDSDANLLNHYALPSTTQNGYNGNGTRSIVTLTTSTTGVVGTASDQCSPYTTGIDITVTIDSYVPTWFAQIVGISQVHNHVAGYSRACKAYTEEAVYGNAVVALSTDSCALTVQGAGTTKVDGSGLYTRGGFCDKGNAGSLTAPNGIKASSCTFSGTGNSSSVAYTCDTTSIPEPKLNWPDAPVCAGSATKTIFAGEHGANAAGQWTPGNIDGDDIVSNDVLSPGIYCISDGIHLTGGSLKGNGVMLYFKDKGATFNFSGGAQGIELIAMSEATAPDAYSKKYAGIVIFMKPLTEPVSPPSDRQTININGGAATTLAGAIWAPSGDVTLSGGSDNTKYLSQVIGWTVNIGGNAHLDTYYDDVQNLDIVIPPTIQIIK